MSDNEQRAVAAYVEGRIEVEELEEALDHIHAGRGLPFTEPVPGKLPPPPRPRDAARSARPRWARPWLG